MSAEKPRLTRRTVLRGSALTLAVFAAPTGIGDAVAVDVDGPGFLTDAELTTLRALVDRIVPGTPEDPDPGAVEARCAEAIDALLAAFDVDPPRIYAGAPFSDRGGHSVNHFEDFLPLDAYEATAWQLRIEGSRGRPELEFNGPVPGFQTIYRDGLAALDAAGPTEFATLPWPARDVVLETSDDPAVRALLDVAVPHTMEFLYGAPEYGGNEGLVGWRFTHFDGDVQPRGYTDEQVEHRDEPGLPELLPSVPDGVTQAQVEALLPLASPEVLFGLRERTGGTLRGMRAQVAAILQGVGHGG